jgi:hypothetical protein
MLTDPALCCQNQSAPVLIKQFVKIQRTNSKFTKFRGDKLLNQSVARFEGIFFFRGIRKNNTILTPRPAWPVIFIAFPYLLLYKSGIKLAIYTNANRQMNTKACILFMV